MTNCVYLSTITDATIMPLSYAIPRRAVSKLTAP